MRVSGSLRCAAAGLGLLLGGAAMAQPLPPPRPSDLGLPDIRTDLPPEVPPPVVPPPAPSGGAAAAIQDPVALCIGALRERGIMAERAPVPASRDAACRIENPVRLLSVRASGRAEAIVALPERPLLDCRFAGALGDFIGTVAAPLAEGHLGTGLKAVRTGPGFECRNRNRATQGKLSAHASGLALDIAQFDFANGESLRVQAIQPPKMAAVFAAIRRAGCGWFTTILGPGSDAAHADHLHLDIMQHGSSERYRICQ